MPAPTHKIQGAISFSVGKYERYRVASRVSSAAHRGVRADVEVRSRRAPYATLLAIPQKTFAGEERGVPRQRIAPEDVIRAICHELDVEE